VAAGQLSPEEARQFIAGKYFAFTCFDGSRGSGRIQSDGSVAGTIQFGGSGPVRLAHLPINTIRISSDSVCASLKGIPFEPCFNVDKTDEVSFRGSVSGMGFAYCDFHHQGGQILMTRVMSRPRSLHPSEFMHPSEATRSAEAARNDVTSHTEVTSRVETPHVEIGKIDPVKSEPAKVESPKVESSKAEGTTELRRSTD
jgi:hypothetical protein